jgi:hypothetical protein
MRGTATLKSYVLYQDPHQHVTEPLLREPLPALGIASSAGQLKHLLSEDQEAFPDREGPGARNRTPGFRPHPDR